MKTTNGQPKSKPRTPRLTPRGQKILTAWVEQPNVERAAAAAGVSTTTLWRYRQKPEFKKALSDLGRLDLAQALARFQQVAMAAANTKIKVMVDPTSPAAVRLHAAELILSHAREAMEREDLEARVAALEQAPGPHRGPQLVSQPADPEVRAMDAQMPAGLSRRQEKILLALLEHPTDENAAAAAGVSSQTVARYRKRPEFQKAYLEARRTIVSEAMIRMQQACPLAVNTILRLTGDPGTPPATRLRAAAAIVRFGLQGLELDTCDVRLSELERENRQIRRVA